jgi:hypothetical protein
MTGWLFTVGSLSLINEYTPVVKVLYDPEYGYRERAAAICGPPKAQSAARCCPRRLKDPRQRWYTRLATQLGETVQAARTVTAGHSEPATQPFSVAARKASQ